MGKDRKKIRRGDVFFVHFDPTVGSEIKKTRPAVVLQNDVANEFSPTTIVAAISSFHGETIYPTDVLVQEDEVGLKKASVILLNQVRTIDKQRIGKRLGSLKPETMLKVERALEISLGLIDI